MPYHNTNSRVLNPTTTTTSHLSAATSLFPVPSVFTPTGSTVTPWSTPSKSAQLFVRDDRPSDDKWSPGFEQEYRKEIAPMIAMSVNDLTSIYPDMGESLKTAIEKAARAESYVDLTAAVQALHGLTTPFEDHPEWDADRQETASFRLQSVTTDWTRNTGPYWLAIKTTIGALDSALHPDDHERHHDVSLSGVDEQESGASRLGVPGGTLIMRALSYLV